MRKNRRRGEVGEITIVITIIIQNKTKELITKENKNKNYQRGKTEERRGWAKERRPDPNLKRNFLFSLSSSKRRRTNWTLDKSAYSLLQVEAELEL